MHAFALSRMHDRQEQWFTATFRVVKADCVVVVVETDAGVSGIGCMRSLAPTWVGGLISSEGIFMVISIKGGLHQPFGSVWTCYRKFRARTLGLGSINPQSPPRTGGWAAAAS